MKLYMIRMLLVLLTVGIPLGVPLLENAGASSVVCVLIPGLTQDQLVCVTTVGVNPPNPSPEDSIEIIVSGTFSTICPEVLSSSHTLVGNQIFITILIELHPDAEVCILDF